MAVRPLGVGALVVIIVFSGFTNSLQARANGELTRHIANGLGPFASPSGSER